MPTGFAANQQNILLPKFNLLKLINFAQNNTENNIKNSFLNELILKMYNEKIFQFSQLLENYFIKFISENIFYDFPSGVENFKYHPDIEFDRPINIYFNGMETNIPDWKSYSYYDLILNNKLSHEVGDFLRLHTSNPLKYSNDIRHQYVSAIYARNFGQYNAKKFGDYKEKYSRNSSGSGNLDSETDQLNNAIGREYALKYYNIPREQLLEILFKDWEKNSRYVNDILNNK